MTSKNLFTTFKCKDNNTFAQRKMLFRTLCVCTIFLHNFVTCEVYSSASDMKNIFRLEVDLADSLNNYATKTQAKLDRINKYIQV